MLTSFTVKNYRGFRDRTVEGLTRINLIAGENNSGKTSLLEAVHLHNRFFDTESTMDVNRRRGILVGLSDLKTTWPLLFHDFEPASPFVFESVQSDGLRRKVQVSLTDIATVSRDHPDIMPNLLRDSASSVLTTDAPVVSIKYEDSSGDRKRCLLLSRNPVMLQGWCEAPNTPITSRFLATRATDDGAEVAEYSAIEISGRQEELLLPALRFLQPGLRRLSLAKLADRDSFFADIGRKNLVPIASMGEGVRRVLSFVLAIANSAGGIVLIDEIENGLHHSVLENVWQAIGDAARAANCQVFATTHSYECIQAAQRAFSDNGEEDLTFIRLERRGDDIRAIVADEESLETAIGHGWELR